MDMNANDGIAANREYKDRLFTFIFGKEENRPYLLQLYNALTAPAILTHQSWRSPRFRMSFISGRRTIFRSCWTRSCPSMNSRAAITRICRCAG